MPFRGFVQQSIALFERGGVADLLVSPPSWKVEALIDLLPIRKKGLRQARPIPTALVIVGSPGNPLHFSETSKPH